MKKILYFAAMFLILLISCTSSLPSPGVVFFSGFESGGAEGWTGRGSAEVMASQDPIFRGDYSLLVTNRSQVDEGPAVDLTSVMKKGFAYKISLWVYPAGQSPGNIFVSVERELNGKSRLDTLTPPVRLVSGVWFSMEGTYTFASDVDKIGLVVQAEEKDLSFYIDNITVTEIGPVDLAAVEMRMEPDLPPLKDSFSDVFKIGAAVEPYQLFGEESTLLSRHFNSITPENAMKMEAVQPEEGVFTFDEGDRIVEYAEANNMQVRGHALVWHRAVPSWVFEGKDGRPLSRELLLERMERHIKTTVGHYKGHIYAWDVVNEPVDKYTSSRYNESEWYNIIGEEYIEMAFRWAHDADPGAKLFINEYDTFDAQKGDLLYNLVKKLLDKGVPIHGVGMQYHISILRPSLPAVKKAMLKFRSLGLEVHITELDMNVYLSEEQDDFGTVPRDILVRQGHRYKEIMEIFKGYSDMIQSVTFWGYHDGHTFMTQEAGSRANAPLIFDTTLKAKPAYWGMVDPSRLPPDVILSMELKEPDIVEAVYGTPVIDGLEDDLWSRANSIYTNMDVIGRNGAKAEVRTAWDENNLYIYAFIEDSKLKKSNRNPWEQDSFEIFIDENNSKAFDYEEDDAQYRINIANEYSFGGYPRKLTSVVKEVPGGYVVEASIAFGTIIPGEGVEMGFDLQVNDDQGSGQRDAATKWNDPTNEGYRNTMGFGVLKMVK